MDATRRPTRIQDISHIALALSAYRYPFKGQFHELTRAIEALDTGHEGSQTEPASTAAYVDALFALALEQRASDLHLEPQKVGLQIRLRVDGLLHDLPSPSPNIAQRLCARIKIMAKLDIAERRLPQDGRISVHCRGQQMDLRVSSLPTLWGKSSFCE